MSFNVTLNMSEYNPLRAAPGKISGAIRPKQEVK